MSDVIVKLPDYLRRQAEAVTAREQISLDELVSPALASHVSAWQPKGFMEERAQRGTWEKFKAVLNAAPDAPPPDWGSLPESGQR